MDTESLYMPLSGDKVEKLIRPEMKLMWEKNRENECRDDCRANEHYNFSAQNLSAALEIQSEVTWSFQ